MIVSKQKIIAEYNRIYDKYPNDAKRFAAVSVALGIDTDLVVETICGVEITA